MDAVKQAGLLIEEGYEYVVEMDIKDFFNHIDHDILLHILEGKIEDKNLYGILKTYIQCTIEYDLRLIKKTCGITQGSAISPVLSNLYLQEFDQWMEQQGYQFVRFADNINIYIQASKTGYDIYQAVAKKLEEYHLEINPNKKGIYPACSRKYLGYCFEKKGKQVITKRAPKRKHHIFHSWNSQALEKIDHNYHLVNQGILSKQDYTVLFENEEKKVYIPVEVADSINVYSHVDISSRVFEELSKRSLNLNIFNKYGVYQGSFYSSRQRNRMKCLMKQVEIYQSGQRLEYAKKINIASMHNLRCNLRYYLKKKPSPELKECIDEISKGIKEMNEVKDIEKLLLVEARCRQKYYQSWNIIIADDEFTFTQRSKRPPKDALNAMISFGNVCLYQRIAQIIHKSQLDIRVSFVHSAMKRYENLNLDLADIFKPVIIDRVIFRMIHKKMISAEAHFRIDENGGVYLNTEGKRIMLECLDWKLNQIISQGEKPVTYERLLYQEVYHLEKSLLEGGKYKPFKYQM